MPSVLPQWQQLALYAVAAALIIMLLQRIPVVGRLIRFAVSLGLFAFFIFILMSRSCPGSPAASGSTTRRSWARSCA